MEEYNTSKNRRRRNLNNKRNNPRKKKGGNPSSRPLKAVYADTMDWFIESGITPPPSTLIDVFDTLDITVDTNEPNEPTIETKNSDTFEMAKQYVDIGLNPLVLNMASNYKPGGGVLSGKTAQEECLFRVSNAFMTHPLEWYPLAQSEIIYSPEVMVIKDKNHKYLKNPYTVGMITVPAIRKPRLVQGEYNPNDRELMTEKIEAIFKTAIQNNHDSLVLGALGCGVFLNPPTEVANIFKTMIRTYGSHFKRIGFAVLVVKSSDNDNLKVFSKLSN